MRFFNIDRTTNVAPVAVDQVVNAAEGTPIVITLAANDANGDTLAYSLGTLPTRGTLSNFDPIARTVTYTPTGNLTGPDSFTFIVNDGKLGIDSGLVSLNVLPVNDAPTAANQAVTMDEDTSRLVVLGASDVETPRAGLTFNLVTGPANGTLVQGVGGGWTYTPNANFFGADSFTYTVTDRGDPDNTPANTLTSAVATISITVTPVNDAPVIAPVADPTVIEGSPLVVDFDATDVENNTLTFSLVAPPRAPRSTPPPAS